MTASVESEPYLSSRLGRSVLGLIDAEYSLILQYFSRSPRFAHLFNAPHSNAKLETGTQSCESIRTQGVSGETAKLHSDSLFARRRTRSARPGRTRSSRRCTISSSSPRTRPPPRLNVRLVAQCSHFMQSLSAVLFAQCSRVEGDHRPSQRPPQTEAGTPRGQLLSLKLSKQLRTIPAYEGGARRGC